MTTVVLTVLSLGVVYFLVRLYCQKGFEYPDLDEVPDDYDIFDCRCDNCDGSCNRQGGKENPKEQV